MKRNYICVEDADIPCSKNASSTEQHYLSAVSSDSRGLTATKLLQRMFAVARNVWSPKTDNKVSKIGERKKVSNRPRLIETTCYSFSSIAPDSRHEKRAQVLVWSGIWRRKRAERWSILSKNRMSASSTHTQYSLCRAFVGLQRFLLLGSLL